MKVSECEKCKAYERHTWTNSYKPANYHRVGVSHAYGYCRLVNMRCSEVKPYVCPKRRYADQFGNLEIGTVAKVSIFDEGE